MLPGAHDAHPRGPWRAGSMCPALCPVSSLGAVTTVLLATDADWILEEVDAALADEGTTVFRVRTGADVLQACRQLDPDLVVLDMQMGNMGGIAACTAIRHEEMAGRFPATPVLLLLDRAADVFLAHRSEADGWLIKPLDAFRLREAAEALLAGDSFTEGVEADEAPATDGEVEAEPAA